MFNANAYHMSLKEDLIQLILKNELGITDYKNWDQEISFLLLQSPDVKAQFAQYHSILKVVFDATELRSIKPHALANDTKPVVNLLRQMLDVVGYKLTTKNIWEGTISGKKTYRCCHKIVKSD